jgi:membrane protein DedA with SNARE-associated domain
VAVPFAAAVLVEDPLSFVLFVASGTAGATLGSYFLYWLFATLGFRALERYGRYVRVSEGRIRRGQDLFRRYGESSVLWGRLLPVLRSLVSIPAGLAAMDARKFVGYSALGSLVFTAAVGALVSYGVRELPARVLLDVAVAVAATSPLLVAGVAVLLAVVTLAAWLGLRDRV